jgi:hypothetical protein
MQNNMIAGIGCFAKPETLSRVFNKMVRDFALGRIEGIGSENRHEWGGPEAARLIAALMAGEKPKLRPLDSTCPDDTENGEITGFFLTLKDQKLNLSIFAKTDGCRQQRYSAVLDGITQLRHSRLN